ncbi:hypothetical protein CTAYLR_006356 [Chrysophaeum taylorii]|uniref:YHYH domain-containing protein n=1 Tax=Chrysophaeum taylorii TaxID=2483200 RepID=A0AAD7U6D1_9STRA|nr:hypothetical protein CTAYLR_006356 [Chrysophaeum taylorii]
MRGGGRGPPRNHPGRVLLEEAWRASQPLQDGGTFGRELDGPPLACGLRAKTRARLGDGVVLVKSNGVPDYDVPATWKGYSRSGRWDGNPNSIGEQDYLFAFPLVPGPPGPPVPTPLGPVGVAQNGVPFYDPRAAEGADAVQIEAFDACCGHPDGSSRYHYHQFPKCCAGASSLGQLAATQPGSVAAALRQQLRDERPSPPLGAAFDGHPIHGPVGVGRGGPVRLLRPSFRGTTYVEGSGDLDECNGALGPDGVYRYHATVYLDGDDVVPVYPYILPAYRSRPDPRNFPPHALRQMGITYDGTKENLHRRFRNLPVATPVPDDLPPPYE